MGQGAGCGIRPSRPVLFRSTSDEDKTYFRDFSWLIFKEQTVRTRVSPKRPACCGLQDGRSLVERKRFSLQPVGFALLGFRPEGGLRKIILESTSEVSRLA